MTKAFYQILTQSEAVKRLNS